MNKITMKSKQSVLMLIVFLFFAGITNAQVYTNKEVGKKNKELADSLKKSEYNYVLPIWGKKATEKGFNLPYSAGVSLNYFWQKSDLIIDNLQVGFNNGELYQIDELVKFNKAEATASALTVRPDFWLFPFLNIYGIFGWSQASTDVGFGVWVPDSSNVPKEVFSTESKIEFNTNSAGFGITPTMGVGGGWIALDMNFSWTDVPQLDKPAFVFVFGPRFGKTFKFKQPERNIALWAGAFRVALNSGTSGSVNLSDVLPVDELGGKIDQGMQKVDDAQFQVNTWWESLSTIDQQRPSNIAKYEAANAALAKASEILNAADMAVGTVTTSTVQYSMDKRPKDMWNFILGTQFQMNKHWMIRAEAGFLASRTQVNAGLQYRFGL